MKKILIIGPFPPYYSYGGPTKSLIGIYNNLSSVFECSVLSPDKELNGSKKNISRSDSSIIYTSQSLKFILSNSKKYDIIWLNSFFDLKLIILIALSYYYNFKLIVSPRGQLSNEAINTSKRLLKKIFILIIKIIDCKVTYHITGKEEKKEVHNKLNKVKLKELPNLFDLKFKQNNSNSNKFLFYSRIHKKKGLYYLLKVLDINKININLDIYGFIEDIHYWSKCKKIIDKLPNVKYKGEVKNGKITSLSNKYTFFILPTLNENYGHVIIELISLGIIPIISKLTTPFDKILTKEIGLNFDLSNDNELIKILNQTDNMEKDQVEVLREKVLEIYLLFETNLKSIKKDYIKFIKEL